jgi:hypothetical protein
MKHPTDNQDLDSDESPELESNSLTLKYMNRIEFENEDDYDDDYVNDEIPMGLPPLPIYLNYLLKYNQ